MRVEQEQQKQAENGHTQAYTAASTRYPLGTCSVEEIVDPAGHEETNEDHTLTDSHT